MKILQNVSVVASSLACVWIGCIVGHARATNNPAWRKWLAILIGLWMANAVIQLSGLFIR